MIIHHNICTPKLISGGVDIPGEPFTTVGHLSIPESIFNHEYVDEVRAVAHLCRNKTASEKVIGTGNSRQVELYGWAENVGRHVDCTGLVYFMPIYMGRSSRIFVQDKCQFSQSEYSSWRLRIGNVYCLNDYHWHWTNDSEMVISLFVGSYDTPHDKSAIRLFREGLQKLAASSRDAPRIYEGYQTMFDWECYAMAGNTGTKMSIEEAKRKDYLIIECSLCEEKAFTLDNKFPYFWEGNRCQHHLDKGDAA